MIDFTMSDMSDTSTSYVVDSASNGELGVQMAKKQQYDLVITDQKMPGMVDGLSVIRQLRALPEYQNVPILMLTMETTEEMKNAARKAGATGWINKPFTPISLVTIAQRVLR